MSEQAAGSRRYRRRTVRVRVEFAPPGESMESGTATTLGAGGLFIPTDAAREVGTPLMLRFQLPGSSTRHVLEGKVSWVHRPADGQAGQPGMGVAFSDRDDCADLARELEDLA